MKHKTVFIQSCLLLLALTTLLWAAAPTLAQSQAAMPVGQDSDDITRRQLADFDHFLDKHPELAEQLRKDPSLVNNEEFVENHRDLREYMQRHPEIREEISRNPNRFMHKEERYERHEDRDRDRDRDEDRDRDRDRDITRSELSNMDRFMDSHPEIAEQLRKDPSLVNNKEFVENHAALRQFLSEHPGIREEYKENPNAFMHQEQQFDRHEDFRDRDVTHGELANMDRFMDSHPEIAEQLRKDPSLVNNKEFVENHAALRQFLAEHPGVREEYKENPNAFMHQEQRFDRREDTMTGRNRDVNRGELSSFNEFLGGHSNIAGELSKNPSLANNQEYLENHSALRDYLKANPTVQAELSKDPQAFLKSTQEFKSVPAAPPKVDMGQPKSK
jgi:GrpB-like predicted nucleotidyltransferase (UPF0157 family)